MACRAELSRNSAGEAGAAGGDDASDADPSTRSNFVIRGDDFAPQHDRQVVLFARGLFEGVLAQVGNGQRDGPDGERAEATASQIRRLNARVSLENPTEPSRASRESETARARVYRQIVRTRFQRPKREYRAKSSI